MPYTKTISFFTKKTIAALFLLFCCVGNIKPDDKQVYDPRPIIIDERIICDPKRIIRDDPYIVYSPPLNPKNHKGPVIHNLYVPSQTIKKNNNIILLDAISPVKEQDCFFHLQHDNAKNILIKSNQKLKSRKKGLSLFLNANEQQEFKERAVILINGIGRFTNYGEFECNQNISTEEGAELPGNNIALATFSTEQLKRGITLAKKNGRVAWYPGIIPFSELEDPKEIAEEENGENDSTKEVMNNFYNPEQPTPLMDYNSATENTPEPKISFFKTLSNNKATVVCATTGLAIAAVLAHVLSGHNYLAQADSWSLWSPSGLNALALRSLPQNVLLEKLHQEIEFRYGNGPDRVTTFLKEIKEEIHQLNLCNWSYSSLYGLYLLPKIQSFENISQRIHLLEMFIYTIEQEMANKAITSLP